MPETRTVKGFSEDGLPFAEGDFESGPLWPLRYLSKYCVVSNDLIILTQNVRYVNT